MAGPSPLRQRKILLLGDTQTGKHCYVKRIIDNKYPNDAWSNKECDISSIKVKIDEHTEVPVQILVIHGAERGKTKIKKYFKSVDGYFIMFDVTRAESYDNIVGWKNNIDDENKLVQLPCVLLANKCDLEKDELVKVQIDTINNYCEFFGFRAHFEISCKDDIGIQQSFQHLIREIIQSAETPTPDRQTHIQRPPSPVKKDIILKILVIGERGTGKTAIIQRYANNMFTAHYLTTVGTDLVLKKIQYNNDIINIHIWDIAGDERFGTMTQLFYKDAAGCLIVFDVSKASTLKGAVKWKDDFDTKVNSDPDRQVPCLLVGNKCDLEKDGIVMSETHMTNFCDTHQFIRWFETSARDNKNIVETFSFLVTEIMTNPHNRTDGRRGTSSEPIRIHDAPPLPRSNNQKCCHV